MRMQWIPGPFSYIGMGLGMRLIHPMSCRAIALAAMKDDFHPLIFVSSVHEQRAHGSTVGVVDRHGENKMYF